MGGWKRGAKTDPQMARWGNLFFLISLAITIWGVKALPIWWLLSLVTTPVLGLFFLTNIIYGFPKVIDYFPVWIYKQIKKLIKRYKS